MKFYVRRSSKHNPTGYSYVGPLAEGQAQKEARAWQDTGESVEILEATPEIRAYVRRWEKICRAEDARDLVFFHGEQMSMASYRLNYEAA